MEKVNLLDKGILEGCFSQKWFFAGGSNLIIGGENGY